MRTKCICNRAVYVKHALVWCVDGVFVCMAGHQIWLLRLIKYWTGAISSLVLWTLSHFALWQEKRLSTSVPLLLFMTHQLEESMLYSLWYCIAVQNYSAKLLVPKCWVAWSHQLVVCPTGVGGASRLSCAGLLWQHHRLCLCCRHHSTQTFQASVSLTRTILSLSYWSVFLLCVLFLCILLTGEVMLCNCHEL